MLLFQCLGNELNTMSYDFYFYIFLILKKLVFIFYGFGNDII